MACLFESDKIGYDVSNNENVMTEMANIEGNVNIWKKYYHLRINNIIMHWTLLMYALINHEIHNATILILYMWDMKPMKLLRNKRKYNRNDSIDQT